MPCKCNQTHEQDDDKKDCPEGQTYDVSQGKCVPKEDQHNNDDKDKDKKKEQIGDPQAQSTQSDLPEGDPGEVQQVDSGSCGPGHKWDEAQQQCIPTSPEVPEVGATKGTEHIPKWANSLQTQIKALEQSLGLKNKKPTAEVNSGNEQKTMLQVAEEYPRELEDKGKYTFHIPLKELRSIRVARAKGANLSEVYRGVPLQIQEMYKPGKIEEAVSITNTHATQDLDTDVAIVPGGISFVPVFQFAKTKEIGQGMDRARFFKTTLPANGSQTVGTTPSEATQTLTSIEVTPSTITGVYLIGDFDEIENSPFDLLQAIVEASAATFEDFVATDMLDTVSAEGTLTPGLWIRGDTGATITDSDIDSNPLDETGVAFGREYLEDQGYLRGGIKPVLALHPKQWRELITSTNVTSLATRSVPDIWLKAQLEEFMGVQLVVTNAVEAKNNQTYDAYNAIMFIPKHTYGIGIKRDVTVKMHEIGEDNQVRVNTTWRVKSGVIDASSTVRISTEQ